MRSCEAKQHESMSAPAGTMMSQLQPATHIKLLTRTQLPLPNDRPDRKSTDDHAGHDNDHDHGRLAQAQLVGRSPTIRDRCTGTSSGTGRCGGSDGGGGRSGERVLSGSDGGLDGTVDGVDN